MSGTNLTDAQVFDAIANATNANTTIGWAVYNGNTYLVEQATASNTAGLAATDVAIKLSGSYTFTDADFATGTLTCE